jgi:hypothetical protein
VAERVTCSTARTAARAPEIPALENGRLTDDVWPEAIVKLVAVPIVAPLAFTKDTVPVQDAAVPAAVAVAILVRLTRAVSVLPNPNGGKFAVFADVVLSV